MFFTAAVGEARKINTELFELSGLPENLDKTQLASSPRLW